jgi:WhiB family redox-sensing transcriptional regulator
MGSNATIEARLHRSDALYQLLQHLTAADFGGHPACADDTVDPDWFFPVTKNDQERITRALTVCRRCELRESCAQFALTTGQEGIWGGTTDEQRAQMRAGQPRTGQERGAA